MRPALWLPLLALLGAAPAWAELDGGLEGDGGLGDLATLPPADPDAPRVGASLDRTEGLVGDRLTLTVSAVARPAVARSVHLPGRLELGRFEVLDESQTDRDLGDGNHSRRFVLQIAAYETGELEVPRIELAYVDGRGERRTVATAPIAVRLRGVVDDDKADLQPNKPPREILVPDERPLVAAAWAGAGLLGLVLFVAIRALVRRRRGRPRPAPVVAPRPPHEVALERIEALRRQGEFDRGSYQPLYFALSEILRAYLGDRFAIDARELTTAELVARMEERHDSALTSQRELIRGQLEAWDLVKFAKAPSSDSEARASLDAAETVVRATIPTSALPGSGEASGG